MVFSVFLMMIVWLGLVYSVYYSAKQLTENLPERYFIEVMSSPLLYLRGYRAVRPDEFGFLVLGIVIGLLSMYAYYEVFSFFQEWLFVEEDFLLESNGVIPPSICMGIATYGLIVLAGSKRKLTKSREWKNQPEYRDAFVICKKQRNKALIVAFIFQLFLLFGITNYVGIKDGKIIQSDFWSFFPIEKDFSSVDYSRIGITYSKGSTKHLTFSARIGNNKKIDFAPDERLTDSDFDFLTTVIDSMQSRNMKISFTKVFDSQLKQLEEKYGADYVDRLVKWRADSYFKIHNKVEDPNALSTDELIENSHLPSFWSNQQMLKFEVENSTVTRDGIMAPRDDEVYLILTIKVQNNSNTRIELKQTNFILRDKEGNGYPIAYTTNKVFKNEFSANRTSYTHIGFMIPEEPQEYKVQILYNTDLERSGSIEFELGELGEDNIL